MRKWQAIPVAAVAAFLAGAALFTSVSPVARADPPPQTVSLVCQVHADCKFPDGTTSIDVDVVLTNNDVSPVSVSNFNFEVYNGNPAFLTPLTPDPTASGFNCSSPVPVADNGLYTNATDSTVSCINPSTPSGDIIVQPSDTATLGTAHFTAVGPDSVDLILTNVTVGGSFDLACDPDTGSPPDAPTGAGLADCTGATVIVGQGGLTSTPAPPTSTPTPVPPTKTPCVANCPTSTSLAYVTITPNAGTQTATAPTAVPATAVPGGPPPPPPPAGGGTQPGGGAGAGGARPVHLPDAGVGGKNSVDWTAAMLLSLLAVAIGGATGALYFGAAHISASRRGRDG